MTATGYDDNLRARASSAEVAEADQLADSLGVSRAEVIRRAVCEYVERHANGEIDDDIRTAADRARVERRQEIDDYAAGLRLATKNSVQTKVNKGKKPHEICQSLRHRYERAELLPEELYPEAVCRFIDCLQVLVHVYDDDDAVEVLSNDVNGIPSEFYHAAERLNDAYPDTPEGDNTDGHVRETYRFVRAADVSRARLGEVDDRLHTDVLVPVLEGDDADRDDARQDKPVPDGAVLTTSNGDRLTGQATDGGTEHDDETGVRVSDSTWEVLTRTGTLEAFRRLEERRDDEPEAWLAELRGGSRGRKDADESDDAPELVADGGIPTETARNAQTDERQQGLTDVDTDRADGTDRDRDRDGGGDADGDADGQAYITLRERIRAELQPFEELHSLNYSHRHGNTTYFVAVRTCSWDVSTGSSSTGGMLVRDARTVVYDKETEDVRVTDNGLWVPEDSDAARAEGLLRSFSRTVTDARSDDDTDADVLVQDASGRGIDVDSVLSQEVPVPNDDDGDGYTQDTESMKDHEGISPSRSWGYYGGAPPEVHDVADRLREAGLSPEEHLIRLQFGLKRPFDTVDDSQEPPQRGYEPDNLLGNYGVDVLTRDTGLVAVDVDNPEAFPDDVDVPETYSISSPHGSDERRHMVFVCDDKDRLADELGCRSINDATHDGEVWGDLWFGGNRFIVGEGCQIGAHACSEGEHKPPRSEGCSADGCDGWLGCEKCRNGCEICSDADRGYYRRVVDAPIAEIDADTVLSLVDTGDSQKGTAAGNELSDSLPEPEEDDDVVRTSCCNELMPVDATFEWNGKRLCDDGVGCNAEEG